MLPGQIALLILGTLAAVVLALMGLFSFNTYKKEKAKKRRLAARKRREEIQKREEQAAAKELEALTEQPDETLEQEAPAEQETEDLPPEPAFVPETFLDEEPEPIIKPIEKPAPIEKPEPVEKPEPIAKPAPIEKPVEKPKPVKEPAKENTFTSVDDFDWSFLDGIEAPSAPAAPATDDKPITLDDFKFE